LGLDKSNVRQVVHFELPGSIEAYFQEIGRGGRDGQPTFCTLLFDQDDIATQMEFIKWSNPDAAFIERVYRLIERYPDKVKAGRYDYLREEMNYYNRRDFRVETAVGLLESMELVEKWTIKQPFQMDGDYKSAQELRLKGQHMKLLDLVRWAQSEECRMQIIYKYFGNTDAQPCGVCDNCKG
jgi:ATP-dependent DNA helicase RecQ